jgi:CrcB protein
VPADRLPLRALVVQLPVDPDLDVTTSPLGRRQACVLVALGGIAGSLARAGVAAAVPAAAGGHPAATLTVNLVGSMLLAVLLAALHERPRHAPQLRPLLGTGFCGGFTTFSTFAVETVTRGGAHPGLAVGYVVASVVGSLLAAAAGLVATRTALRLADRSALLRRLHHAAPPDEEAA